MKLDMVAVHPAYWRRGHGSTLVKWLNSLADEDQTEVAVSAVPMGRKLFEHMGFHMVEQPIVPGYGRHPEHLLGWLGVRQPKSRFMDWLQAWLFAVRNKFEMPVVRATRGVYKYMKQHQLSLKQKSLEDL